jgi:membrane-associated protein
LPGDSLLLTAGLLASRLNPDTGQAYLNIWLLIPLLFAAAVLGDNVGYWFGAKAGPRIFNRENSLLFRRRNLLAARAFYDRHGGKTITLARFMPFIRTFAPIVAGAVGMNYRRFMLFNLLGGLVWAMGVTLAGYVIGSLFGTVEGLDRYFTLLVLVVIFVSALPAIIHVWRENRGDILARLRTITARKREPEA